MSEHGEPITLRLRHGLTLAAVASGPAHATPTLALHGWLDNAASFAPVAPWLHNARLVALDLPGHGHSQHRPPNASYHFIDWVPDVLAAADALGWQQFQLLGHSMGAAIALLVAGVTPHRVTKLAIVDGLGPSTTSPEDAPEVAAKAIAARAKFDLDRAPKQHPSLDAALDRMLQARMPMSRDAAALIAARGATMADDGSVVFHHDPALHLPSLLRLSEAHLLAFLRKIACPTLMLRPRDGWPVSEAFMRSRLDAITHAQLIEVDGGHHVHMDAPERVGPLLADHLDPRV